MDIKDKSIHKSINNKWIDLNLTKKLPPCPPINNVSVGHIYIK